VEIRPRFAAAKTRRRLAIAAVTVAAIAGMLLINPSAAEVPDSTSPTAATEVPDTTPPTAATEVPDTTPPIAAAEVSEAAPPSSSPELTAPTNPPAPTIPAAMSMSEAVQVGVAGAAAVDVEQAVAVIDRRTGQFVASHAGDTAFNAESIGKLFTAAYYLHDSEGMPSAMLSEDLRSLITESNNGVQISLWQADIIPTIADRYQLENTYNSRSVSPNTWGSDQITADDEVTFLAAMSQDPMVGPQLMEWMSQTEPFGGDGFDQSFGLNSLTGDHGSKQGWSDPGWTPANLHSVGWTDRYFVAILQTSPTATNATMRATSTETAELIAAAR